MKYLKDVKEIFENSSEDNWQDLVNEYKLDNRKCVQKIVSKYEKKIFNVERERKRVHRLINFDNQFLINHNCIYGIDEVGRGPLAGPVVSVCITLPKDLFIAGVNDSKKINVEKRIELSEIIKEKAIDISIGICSAKEIDEINILRATCRSMEKAFEGIKNKADILLVDGNTRIDVPVAQETIVKGDSKSMAIACASIVAKVYRDDLMSEYDDIYPQYHFKNNKGYGTIEHIEAIRKYGLLDIHRRSFVKNICQ
ncbi:MAG: ribonuclease HII [Lachnospirales bacterium]